MKKLILSFALLTSCNFKNQLPSSPISWFVEKEGKNVPIVTSKFCSYLIPKEMQNGDITLAQLIDLALINNPQTKISWAQAQEQAENYLASLSSYLPQIDANIQCLREKQAYVDTSYDTKGTSKHKSLYRTQYGPTITLSYLIYDFGKRKSSTQKVKQALSFSGFTHNRAIQQVILNVMLIYYDYQYNIQVLEAGESNLITAEETYKCAKLKYLNGIVSITDLLDSKSKYLQTKINVTSQKNDIESTYSNLLNALGIAAYEKLRIERLPDFSEISINLDNLHAFINNAKKSRQDFLALQAQLKEYQEQVKEIKKTELPALNFDFNIGKFWFNNNETEPYNFTATFSLDFPIFHGFYYKNTAKAAEAQVFQIRSTLAQKELEIIKEVKIAYNTLLASKENLKDCRKYFKITQKQFNAALEAYKAGITSILELLNAQSMLFDAKMKLSEANTNWFKNAANFAYSTGTLASPTDEGEKNI